LNLTSFTLGMGDRFAHEGEAQLASVMEANRMGIPVYPVWNKSNREHMIIGTEPASLRREADAAVRALGWDNAYFVDADHINLNTVDRFLDASNYFTLDVAEHVGQTPDAGALETFMREAAAYIGALAIPGIDTPLTVNETLLQATAKQYLTAVIEAGKMYRYLAQRKGADTFITEVSMDETNEPQTPVELFLILFMLAQQGVPAQTIAPKFTGRFNKGVDYVGSIAQFEKEFDEDLCVVQFAIKTLGFPDTLKLSVHSGSDKFSLYPVIHRLLNKHQCGLHVKTAGTTWLEEVIGLAEAGGDGFTLAARIYAGAYAHYDELIAPYATVIDINRAQLPTPDEVNAWSPEAFADALRHDQHHPAYNPHVRQLIHVGFKIAAKMGREFTDALKEHRKIIAGNVTANLLHRHIIPLFPSVTHASMTNPRS